MDSLDLVACDIRAVVWVAPHTLEPASQAECELSCSADCEANFSYTDLLDSRYGPSVPFLPSPLVSPDVGIQMFFTSGARARVRACVYARVWL